MMGRDLTRLALACISPGSRRHSKTLVEAVGLESEPKEGGRKADRQCSTAEERCEMSELSTRGEKEEAPIQLLCPVLAKGGPRAGVNALERLGGPVRMSGGVCYLC